MSAITSLPFPFTLSGIMSHDGINNNCLINITLGFLTKQRHLNMVFNKSMTKHMPVKIQKYNLTQYK
jgi:hypothetical protein